MKSTFKWVFIVGVLLLISLASFRCASILHGTKQDVSISSSPNAADVTIKTAGGVIVFDGKTPSAIKLERKHEYDVFVSLKGYKETKVHINKSFDALYLGNIICGGIIGLIIDAANGAMNKLEPNVINVTLVVASGDRDGQATYIVFRAMDADGQIKNLVIPLVKS